MTSRAKKILNELSNFTRYEPGKTIKTTDGKDIPGSTAMSKNASVHYDSDPIHGGHFLQRYDINDRLENFRLTHENAFHLLSHLQKYVVEHNKTVSKKQKIQKEKE